MDRKYRQRGYRDDDRPQQRESHEKRESPPGAPRTPMSHDRPRSPVMPGRQRVSRCASCGLILPQSVDSSGQCPKCHFELHSCKQCVNFDTGQRFECIKPIPARVAKKDLRNECTYYEMRFTVEKETSSGGAAANAVSLQAPAATAPRAPSSSARQAFEDLFKK
jgi:predicted RNA-binding Zn-ribbon protein involved in translation (DUF1610 family)